MATDDGYRLLPRLIRYIEDRRVDESRFTGAIENHPSPLGIIWGELDPVAVHPMALRLREACPRRTAHDARRHRALPDDRRLPIGSPPRRCSISTTSERGGNGTDVSSTPSSRSTAARVQRHRHQGVLTDGEDDVEQLLVVVRRRSGRCHVSALMH